jgi:hypothetical protein
LFVHFFVHPYCQSPISSLPSFSVHFVDDFSLFPPTDIS